MFFFWNLKKNVKYVFSNTGLSRRSRRISDHRWLGRCAYARTRPQMSALSGVDLQTFAELSLLPNTEPDRLHTVALSPCRVSATQICLPPGLPVHWAQYRTSSNWPSDSPWNVSFGHHKSGFLAAVRCRRWSWVVCHHACVQHVLSIGAVLSVVRPQYQLYHRSVVRLCSASSPAISHEQFSEDTAREVVPVYVRDGGRGPRI